MRVSLAAAVLLLVPVSVHAQGGIEFTAPEGCGDVARLTDGARELLGHAPTQVPASVTIAPADPSGFALMMVLHGAERRLTGPSCAELLDAAALVWALAEGDGALPSAAPRPASPSAAGLSAPRFHIRRPTAPPASRAAALRRPTELGLRIGVSGEWGALPAATAGALLELSGRVGRLRFGAGARWWVERRGAVQGGGEGYGDVGLAAGFVRGAVARSFGRVDTSLGLGLELGALRARGGGVRFPGRGRGLWVAPGLSVGSRIALGPGFGMFAGVDAYVPLSRPRFVLEGIGVVHRPRRLSLRVELGISWRWGSRIRP